MPQAPKCKLQSWGRSQRQAVRGIGGIGGGGGVNGARGVRGVRGVSIAKTSMASGVADIAKEVQRKQIDGAMAKRQVLA